MRLDQLLARAAPRVVLDLSGVTYIDSYGLGLLLEAVKRARRADGDLKLCAVRLDIQAVFDATGFSKHVSIEPSRSQAVAAWSNKTPAPKTNSPGRGPAPAPRAAPSQGDGPTGA